MARKKKVKSRGKAKEKDEATVQENNLAAIQFLDSKGLGLQHTNPENVLLAQLKPLVSSEEYDILRLSGAFGEVTSNPTPGFSEFLKSNEYRKFAFEGIASSSHFRRPPPPVPVFAEFSGKSSSIALAGELRYLNTVLHPAEMRWLVAELACDSLEGAPITHTDISDAVIASITPSTAQNVAFQADAQYKYTTAQFLQVYMRMRHVVLEHKIILAGAKADALLLSLSPIEKECLIPNDELPVSAVEALRVIIDSENLLNR